jgi:hypothetical protein
LYDAGHYDDDMRIVLISFAVLLGGCDGSKNIDDDDDLGVDAAPLPPDAETVPDHRIVTGQATPIALVADETAVYWLDQGFRDELDNLQLGAILKRPHTGGDPEIIATGIERGWGLAVDDERIYWTALGDHTIRSVRKDGTDPQTLATGRDAPAIAVGGDRVVWRELGAVVSAAKDGSDVQVLDDAVSADALAIAADATHAYWESGPLIARAPLDGSGAIEDVATDRTAERLAVTPTHLFLATTVNEQKGYFVHATRIDLATGVAVDVAHEPGANPELAIAGGTTYLSVEDPTPPVVGALVRAEFAPGPRTTLAAGHPHISAIAVTESDVYWATTDASDPAHGGAISRLAR